MKRIVISLFVIFSMLFVPLVHAVGVDCLDDNSAVSHGHSKNDKRDNGRAANAHHCCVGPMVDRTDAKQTVAVFISSAVYATPTNVGFASITVGPLLEPPSHV